MTTTNDAWIPERPVDEVRYAMQERGGAVAMHGTGDGGVEHSLIQPKDLIEELRIELGGATDPEHRRIVEAELRERESAHERWLASAGHHAEAEAGVRWAHEDPKVLAYFRRIGTATSTVDRGTARDELQEYLHGPGRHLEIDVEAFAAAHLARVDRTAWTSGTDAARTVPQWKTDHRMRSDYLRYTELIDHAGHGENEYDREQFARRAEELREYWEMTAPHDWAAMRELHQMWQTDPENARQFTAAELRHNPVPNRHLVAAQQAFDPRIREYEQWREMHNQVADLNGELMAARSEDEARQIDARIQALREDRSAWPKSWHKFEEDAASDMEFQREQSERSTERYFQVIDQKPTQTPDLSRSTLTAEQEDDVDELEESPW